MISSSSRKGSPPVVAPILPFKTIRDGLNTRTKSAHHCPQHAFQLVDDLKILALKSMLANEVRKLREMTFLFQDLAAKRSLGHFAIKVRRNGTIEYTTNCRFSHNANKERSNCYIRKIIRISL